MLLWHGRTWVACNPVRTVTYSDCKSRPTVLPCRRHPRNLLRNLFRASAAAAPGIESTPDPDSFLDECGSGLASTTSGELLRSRCNSRAFRSQPPHELFCRRNCCGYLGTFCFFSSAIPFYHQHGHCDLPQTFRIEFSAKLTIARILASQIYGKINEISDPLSDLRSPAWNLLSRSRRDA